MTDQPTPDNNDQLPETPPATEPTETPPAPEPAQAPALTGPTGDDAGSTPAPAPPAPSGERIAKMMARAGVASRREAERMILEGRVTVNGRKIDSPALDILPSDQVRIDGKPMEAPQETRLWLYYKPVGLVTSESDEKGRQTVFDALPRDLPRVMSVGRLDLNSEGLLLLTNDGELKRRLELPATAWLRRYRVRVNGNPTELTFDPLRRGATIDGEDFAPMEIKLDSQQGANAWLSVGIREGRNREIRRAMAHVGLQVNRLIRIGYGPFKLAGLEVNEVREVKRRILRDQLGGLYTGETEGEGDTPRRPRASGAARDMGLRPDRAPRGDAPEGERPARKPRMRKDSSEGDRAARPFRENREGGPDRKPRFAREGDERRPFVRRPEGDRPDRAAGPGDRPARPEGKGFAGTGPRGSRPRPDRADRPDRSDRSDHRPGGGKGFGPRDGGSRREGPRNEGPRSENPRGEAARGGKPWGDRARADTPRGAEHRGAEHRGSEYRGAGPKGAGYKGTDKRTDKGAEGKGAGFRGGFKPGGKAPGPQGGGPRGGGPRAAGPGRGGPKGGPQAGGSRGAGPKGGGPMGGGPKGGGRK